jgi:hypothetical protein
MSLLSSTLTQVLHALESHSLNYYYSLSVLLESSTKFMHASNECLEMNGIFGVNRVKAWWPKDFDLLTAYNSSDVQRITAIEDAEDAGNWAEAIDHHRRLSRVAFRDFDYDKAIEHLDAVAALCKKSPLSQGELESLSLERQRIQELSDQFRLLGSTFEGPLSWSDVSQKTISATFSSLGGGATVETMDVLQGLNRLVIQFPSKNVEYKKGWLRKLMKSYTGRPDSQDYFKRF